ncbi:hypothetical protein RHGRI_033466 [Rhododendron griersonianum]|uniref:Jacalin-type lectin domain-containing protein n=1 Tax=Rhododendron griersonianum TaxID=479676 RepID=A0AAV6I002_9ERIC|nr:hypothetical protein RHGRI_033466 [Rhododendron griersonianum]
MSSSREAYKYLQTPQDTSIQPFDQSLHWHQESPRFPMAMISGEQGWISLGPWGGKGGEYSAYKAEGPIIQITIRRGDVIDSILFESKSYNGNFCIDSSVERLTSISLTYKDYHGQPIITSLSFETNIGNKYGPFGPGSDASSVSIPIEGGFIAGFHGRGGSFLDAIGIFVAPKFSIDSSVEQISSISLTYEEFYGSGEVTIISLGFETNIGNKYGPFGSRTGTSSVSIPIEGGDFVGFHGRVGVYLTAIGVLVAPKHLK